MNKFLVDTDVIIWFLRGKKEAISLFEKIGLPSCSSISIIEVLLGTKEDEKKKTSEFLNSLDVYPVDQETANLTGEYIRNYRKKGIVLEIPDVIIGATCILHNLILVTYNTRHYPFKELKIYQI